MHVQDGTDIDAPIDRVWAVYTDVEHWPDWTESVRTVELLTPGPLRVGSEVRIDQPKLKPTTWTVTELTEGSSWTWVGKSPGLVIVATHELRATGPQATRVDQSIDQHGPLAIVGRIYRKLTIQYLAMEAVGLKARSEAKA